ncbi:MAG: hypothetical protein RLZ97_106 [Verrucomicrobiota bacterium]|jgi:hypothetical protein
MMLSRCISLDLKCEEMDLLWESEFRDGNNERIEIFESDVKFPFHPAGGQGAWTAP